MWVLRSIYIINRIRTYENEKLFHNCMYIEVIIGVDVMYMYIQSALGPYRVQHSEKDTLYPRLSVIK